jgi:hypothetical protein
MSQTPNLLITEVAANQNQKEVTINQAIIELEAAFTSAVTIAMTDADYTLTATEDGQAYGNLAFQFTGTITANRHIILPNTPKLYLIMNNTNASLGVDLIIKCATGGGSTVSVAVSSSLYTIVFCDGTNVVGIA